MKTMNKISKLAMVNTNVCSIRRSTTLSIPHSSHYRVRENFKKTIPLLQSVRHLGLGPTSKDFQEPPQISGPVTKAHAAELVLHLNENERKLLLKALQEYESNRIKEEFEDTLAGKRWRTKIGRTKRMPGLGEVDPTGAYCPVPEDWLKKKFAEKVPKPTKKELFSLALANSIPFIGFGFLDNSIMIIAGDSIESSMSAYITLSTMAAAALGNTFSDVIGIGTSAYVEKGAALLGLGGPQLSPVQLDMPASRRSATMGRVLGITLGCFLGMTPLLFMDEDADADKKKK